MDGIYYGRNMLREIGRCIYCGVGIDETKLTDEHVIPFSLGADTYLKNASCADCQKITSDFETHLARNVFGHLRIHIGVQTRRPKERPNELPTRLRRGGREERVLLSIKDHPNFLVMPVWDKAGVLVGRGPSREFPGLAAHLYHEIPATTGAALGVRHAEAVEIVPDYRVDTEQFARAIAKIGYCQAVGILGLDGFRPLAIRDVILGKYPAISQFVGSRLDLPPPPGERGKQHMVTVYEARITENLTLVLAAVRLFADSGTQEYGMPIYTVVVGAPLRTSEAAVLSP